jgi:hypothetical protein
MHIFCATRNLKLFGGSMIIKADKRQIIATLVTNNLHCAII